MSDLITQLDNLADKFSEGWHEGIEIDALDIETLDLARKKIEQLEGTNKILGQWVEDKDKHIEELKAAIKQVKALPTDKMLEAARDWSIKKYGKAIGNDAAIGCWTVMRCAALEETE